MPTMCSAITNAERSAWPWSFMWGGVIVITPTIAACDAAIAAIPSRAPGDAQITDDDDRTTRNSRVRSACGSIPPITSSGSGRRRIHTTVAATRKKIAANTNGPTSVESDTFGHRLLERREHRSERSAERADPHDGRDRRPLLLRLGEVGGDVALLERGGLSGTERHHADEEQREPAQLSACRGDRGADRADQQAHG
jgi:hypothetical protein